jgi:hypothetical protein
LKDPTDAEGDFGLGETTTGSGDSVGLGIVMTGLFEGEGVAPLDSIISIVRDRALSPKKTINWLEPVGGATNFKLRVLSVLASKLAVTPPRVTLYTVDRAEPLMVKWTSPATL